MHLEGKGEDLFWDSDPLPSLPFQPLLVRLQQLASIAGDVLLGKEKIQKSLPSRLTEVMVMWLSEEQEFWDVFEDDSVELQPSGLQQWEENGNQALSLNTRALDVIWGGEGSGSRYWRRTTTLLIDDEDKESSHEVMELVGVYWLEVRGKVPVKMFSSGATYSFFVTLKITSNASGWKDNFVMFRVHFNGNQAKSVAVDLSEYLEGEWIDVPDEGLEFNVPRDGSSSSSSNGILGFGIYEFEGEEWKKGIIIKDVKFVPQAKLTTII